MILPRKGACVEDRPRQYEEFLLSVSSMYSPLSLSLPHFGAQAFKIGGDSVP